MDETVIAEPGDTVVVTDPPAEDAETEYVATDDAEVNDTDVEIEDHSFNTETDESVNVNVVVEAPETSAETESAELQVLREISSKLDAIGAATTVSAITDIEESTTEPPAETVVDDGTDVVVIDESAPTDDGPTDVKDVTTEERPKRKRPFGKR